jgi:hypothetical protein
MIYKFDIYHIYFQNLSNVKYALIIYNLHNFYAKKGGKDLNYTCFRAYSSLQRTAARISGGLDSYNFWLQNEPNLVFYS